MEDTLNYIDDLIEQWHKSKDNKQTIYEYLGMTKEEYFLFCKTNKINDRTLERFHRQACPSTPAHNDRLP